MPPIWEHPDTIHWTLEREAGRSTRSRSDREGDGVFDMESAAAFDVDGQYLWSSQDEGVDGSVDTRSTFTYDERGFRTSHEVDHGDDGTIDSLATSAFDDEGRVIRSDWDADADGVPELESTYEYVGSAITVFVERVWDEHHGWRGDRHRGATDAQGRFTEWSSDFGDDGIVDQRIWCFRGPRSPHRTGDVPADLCLCSVAHDRNPTPRAR